MTPKHVTTTGHPPSGSVSTPRAKWLALVAACLGLMMLSVDLFIVNVALPAIGRNFHAAVSSVSWTVSGYVLMIGVLPIGMGRLGDLWGSRRLYLAGLTIFLAASLLCGFAPTLPALVAFRVVQGIGAAIMTPSTLAIVSRAFPVAERGLAVGIYGGVSGLGLIAGPVLGGLLVRGDDWRWIFFINLPLGLVAIAVTVLFVVDARDADASPAVDWWGLVLLSVGLLGGMFALTRAEAEGVRNPTVLASLAVGAVALAAFVLVERRVRWPLIDLSLFRNGPFVLTSLGFFLFSASLFGSQPYWSLFMQNYWGFSPLQGGLAFLPATGLIAMLTPLTGLIGQWAGRRLRFIVMLGATVMALAFLYSSRLTPQSTYATGLLPAFLARGVGIPIFSTCATLVIVGAVPASKTGLASGTIGMVRNIGTAFGVALLGGLFLYQINGALPAALDETTGTERAAILVSARQFSPRGAGADRVVAQQAILRGMDTVSLVAAGLCLGAVIAVGVARGRFAGTVADHAREETAEELSLAEL